MEVQMKHALSRLLADVGDHPVAVQPLFLCQLGNDLEDISVFFALVTSKQALASFGDMKLAVP